MLSQERFLMTVHRVGMIRQNRVRSLQNARPVLCNELFPTSMIRSE